MVDSVPSRDFLNRGDECVLAGDLRAATSFYQAALRVARSRFNTDGETAERLRSAEAFIREQTREFNNKLDSLLGSFTGRHTIDSTRFINSIEMLRGSRQIFPQQPTVFYYPFLAQRQFFDREEFAWARELEDATPRIRAELEALIAEGMVFRPYVEDEPNRPARDFHHLKNDHSWSAVYLWRDAQPVHEVARRCPQTMEALSRVPLSQIGKRTPTVLFSRLEAGAHIPPHTGMLNCRLICHLPLIAPSGCTLRVGNETREWEQGKMLIFDDSIEHEARNPTNQTRIVMLFDIWRPELSIEEQRGISTIFQAIDEFQGVPGA